MRFQYEFLDVESKLLRKCKLLKKKKKYTLKQADSIVNWIQNNWTTTDITLLCDDTEQGEKYTFDKIEVVPFSEGGEKISLFSEIENQILQSSDDLVDPNRLIMDINNQFKNEEDEETEESQSEEVEDKKNTSKHKFSLSGFLKKNKNQEIDNSEEDEETEVLEADNEEDNTEEIEELENFEPEEIELEQTDTNETEEETENFEPGETEDEEKVFAKDFETDSNMNIPENVQQVIYSSDTEPKIEKKHETVKLLTMQEYCVLDGIDETIEHMKYKLSVDNLIKLVGFNTEVNNANAKFNECRNNYIKSRLSEIQFENLRETYFQEVSSLKTNALDTLRTAIDIAWKTPYDIEAKNNNKDKLDSMTSEYQSKIDDFIVEQQANLTEKTKQLDAQQKAELESFIASQEAKKGEFIAAEKERMQNLIDAKTEEINKELETEREHFLDEEIYKMKVNTNRDLFDGKRQVKENVLNEISKKNEEIWNEVIKNIKDIKEEISEKTPTWVEEIKKLNELEELDRKHTKEEKELNLKEKQLQLEQIKAEADLKRMQELEHENKLLTIKLQTAESKNQLYEQQQELNNMNNKKKSKFFR